MSLICEELVSAYMSAHFHVFSKRSFVLRINSYSKSLEELHVEAGIECSVFVTAYNPFSQQFSAEQNQMAQLKLFDAVRQLGHSSLEGEGRDPGGQWPGEPSMLVLGCTLEQGKELGRSFKQNAIVWSGRSAVPQLELLR